MNILEKLGISKDSIARLLGVSRTVDLKPDDQTSTTNRTKKRGRGRPAGLRIPQSVVEAVRRANKSYTNQELADKHGVSLYWVWSVRSNKIRRN